jgi:hypothetical protein
LENHQIYQRQHQILIQSVVHGYSAGGRAAPARTPDRVTQGSLQAKRQHVLPISEKNSGKVKQL